MIQNRNSLEDEYSWLSSSPPISPVKESGGKIYKAVTAPICEECEDLNLTFLDPECETCYNILVDPETTIPELFAIMRQWVPQIQKKMDMLVEELFKRGFRINDRDMLTDMTLLHYVVKSGANGMGDVNMAVKLTQLLIEKGILVNAKCCWTDMSALHYAIFFDAYKIVKILLETNAINDMDRPCKEFNNGTALHIGCQNISFKSVEVLLQNGANPHFVDDCGKRPIDYIPNSEMLDGNDLKKIAVLLRNQLSVAMKEVEPQNKTNLNNSVLQSLGLDLHCRVVVSGQIGILRFAGTTEFASGVWAGVELEANAGKNNGSVGGVEYFECKEDHGMFAPITMVKKYDPDYLLLSPSPPSSPVQAEESCSPDSSAMFGLRLGEKVIVAGQKTGFVRYRGPTKFSPGTWVGVELEEPVGKNDGSVGEFRYFRCSPDHGIFAPLSKVQRMEDLLDEEDLAMPRTVKEFLKKKKHADEETCEKKLFLKVKVKTAFEEDESVQDDSLEKEDQNEIKAKGHSNIHPKINTSVQQLSLPKKSYDSKDKTFGAQVNFTLKTGMSVYVNGLIGVLRFIGRVEFADGVWLGVELRKPNGKNDGSVEGKRYFTCKPKYGLMTRPNRATCRGINCEQLVDLKFR